MKKIKRIDRKAWIRVVESFLAILIITSAFLVILSKRGSQRYDLSEEIHTKQAEILDFVSKNETYRKVIIETPETKNNTIIKDVIKTLVPKAWKFSTNICDIDKACHMTTPKNQNVYVSERIVATYLGRYEPKKIRFFVWLK